MSKLLACTNNPPLRFVVMFAAIYCVLASIVVAIPPVSRHFTVVVTEGAGQILSLLGYGGGVSSDAIVNGYAEIRFNSTTYRVHEECTGLFLIFVVGAGVAAFPSSLWVRLVGFILASIVATIIGCLRIVILGCVAEYHVNIFELFHTYIMEVTTVGLALWMLALWFNFTTQRFGRTTS